MLNGANKVLVTGNNLCGFGGAGVHLAVSGSGGGPNRGFMPTDVSLDTNTIVAVSGSTCIAVDLENDTADNPGVYLTSTDENSLCIDGDSMI